MVGMLVRVAGMESNEWQGSGVELGKEWPKG